jgi:methionine salvage enolase-phosphatase E1
LPNLDVIELNGFRLDLDYYLKREYEEIGLASVELPAIIEWLNAQLQVMIEQKIMAEDGIKEAEAKAWFDLQNGVWEDMHYAGKKTAHALVLAVNLNEKVKEAKKNYAIYAGWVTRLQNVIYGFQSKLDITRSVEATRRGVLASMSGPPA